MSLRLVVLGFAGSAPMEGACSSYAVSDGEHIVLLDCGPGTLERVWRFGMLAKLDSIVISHMHVDHILDLVLFAGEFVRGELGGRGPLLYVPGGGGEGRRVLDMLDAAVSGAQRPAGRFDAAFEIRDYGPTDTVSVGTLELTFAVTAHPQPCFAMRVTDGKTSLVYGADGGSCEALERLAFDADLLVLEATYLDDDAAAAAYGHMTAVQAGELAGRSGAQRLLLTHLLPGSGRELLANARSAFNGRIDLAREGLMYDLA